MSKNTLVYEKITQKIIDAIENGDVAAWRKTWNGEIPTNIVSKKAYTGINPFLLSLAGYESKYWMTFKQAKQKGGNVRKGEKGTTIIFWKVNKYTKLDDDGNAEDKSYAMLRYYTVFNIEQVEGVDAPEEPARKKFEPIEAAQLIIDHMNDRPQFKHAGQDRAYYAPSLDLVNLPARDTFESPENYYATAFHELAHATGHKSRLARGLEDSVMFGDHKYSFEELIAEMTATMLCSTAGISDAVFDNNVAYLNSWLKVLKADSKVLVRAATQAQRAADLILEGYNAYLEHESSDEMVEA